MFSFIRQLFQALLQMLFSSKSHITASMNIYIKSHTGRTLPVELNPKWDIRSIKEKIAPKLGLSADDVKIIFAGRELLDSTVIEDCDLGEQSILHAVKIKHVPSKSSLSNDETALSKSTSDTYEEWKLAPEETTVKTDDKNLPVLSNLEPEHKRAHFFVYCPSPCKKVAHGKLRVRCASCKSGAFTVDQPPQCWADVMNPGKITGICENENCQEEHSDGPQFAEFYFKCAEHTSQGETDQAVPLDLIRHNFQNVPCLACTDVSDTVLVFPCKEGHVTCLECFGNYCVTRLRERQFQTHSELGYTLPCPAGCPDSFIREIHHFHVLKPDEYEMYQRFGAEEFVLGAGGVLCPQPGCGMGILVPPDCTRVQCLNGCGFVFCRNCLQGFHLGECLEPGSGFASSSTTKQYNIDPERASQARWDEASKVAIRTTTKPCPKCRTPTERDGGCMHMVCTKPQCNFNWCWVCQTEWNRDCMGSHWFG